MSSWQEYKKKNGISQKVDENNFPQNTMSSWQEYKMRHSGNKQVEQNNSSQNSMSSWQRYKKEQEERQRQEALKKAEEEERQRQEAIKKNEEEQKKQEEQTQKGQVQEFGNDINKNIIYGPTLVSDKKKFEERKNGSNMTKQENSNVLPKVENAQPITNVKNTTEASLEAVRINQDLEKGNYGSAVQHIIKGIPSGLVSGVADIGNAALTVEALNLSKGNQYLNSFIDKMSNAYKAMGKESEEDKNTSLNVLKKLRDFSGNASNKLLDTAETITDKTSEYQNTNSQIDNKYIQTAGNVSSSIGRMIPSIVSNVALPGSGTIVSGVQSMGGSTMETLNEDRSNLDKAILTGVAKGTTTATVEKLTGGDLVTKGGFDKLAAKGIKSKFKNQLTQRLLYKGYQITGEMAEEQIENEVGYVIDKVINDEDMPDLKQRWEEAGETAKITGLTTIALNLMGLGGGSIDDVDISSLSNKDVNTVNDVVNIADYMNSARKYNIDTNDDAIKGIARVTSDRGIKTTYNADMFSNNSQNAIWRISKDESGNTVREVILNPNATDTNKTLQNIIVHELTHDMEGTKQYNDLKNIVLKYDEGKVGYDEARKSLVDIYSKVYDVNGNGFNTLVDNEAVADILGSKLGDQDFINTLTKENRSVGRKIYDWVIDKLNKLNSMIGYKSEKLYWSDVKNKFENAFKQEFSNNSNDTSRFSIQQDQNGNRYVKVDTDQDIFEGIDKKDYNKIAKMYMQDYLKGNTILSQNDTSFIGSKGINKYTNPRQQTKYIDEKMQLAPELKNVLEIAKKVDDSAPSKDTSKYPSWEYYKFNFELGGKNFEGLINIGIDKNGKKHFYEINKIHTTSDLYVSTSKSSSMNSINNSIASVKKDVNTTNKYSMQNGENNSNTRYSISGKTGMENAIKNDPNNIELERLYNKANKMQKAGFDNEQIRQQTNWFQDRNGDWKFEFSDKDMSLKNNIKLEKNKTYKLGDILEHDTLFLLYPELRNYTVEFKNINANGSFYKKDNTIIINNKNINSNPRIEGTLIHEIQHAIQCIEGFEAGSDLSRGKFNYYNSLGEIEATDTKSRFITEKYKGKSLKNIAPVSSQENPKHKDLDNYMKNRKLLDKLKDIRYNNKKRKGDGHDKSIEEDILENTQRNNDLVDGGRRLNTENIKLINKRKGDSHDKSLERDASENKGRDNTFVGNNLFDSESINRIDNESVKKSRRLYIRENGKKIYQETEKKDRKAWRNNVWNGLIDNSNTKNSNMSSFSMQEIGGNAWQNRLDTLYKNNNKGTTIKDVKYPIQKFLDDRKINYELDENGNITNIENPKQIDEFYNRDLKLAPTKSNVKEIKSNSSNKEPFGDSAKSETNLDRYNNYKKNIIKGKETEINSLISYKNESIRNLDNKILEKEALLNSKNNQSENSRAILKSQIEGLKSQKTKLQNSYNEKIDKASSKVNRDKIELETRNMMKKEARDSLKAEVSPLTNDLTKYKDKKAGILFNRETAQRNIDDIVSDSDLASAIKETVFDPVQVHQAEKTREINSLYERINSLGLDKTKKYSYLPDKEIVPVKVDEATLSQLVIEKKITDKDLRNYGFDEAGIKKIHRAADTFTEILDSLYNRMNEEQIKYGYSPIGRIENYFPHFLENKPDTMLGKVASYFGIDLTDKRLPTEIAGRTDTFKPGKTWNSNTQKRRTIKTDYDALTAMERYIKGATEIIYTTEDIQRVREYSKQIRYKYSDKGIQTEIDSIMDNTELTQEAKDLALDGIFKNTENELSNFVTWLDDYANTLAGKKSFADRNMERNIGRNIYSSMSGIESRIAANTIGGNLSVSLTNFAPIAQAAGSTKWSYLLTGMMQTTSNNIKGMVSGSKDTSFVNNSNFLTNRFGTDSISQKKATEKVSDFVSIPMNAIDEFTAESIVRAKYLENIDKGMSEETALDLADKYAAKIMADRSKGALPIVFNTKNPISKLITMFQVEPNNIVSNYLKDMPRDAKSKVQLTKQATKLMVASYAFNSLIMSIRGGNEVLPDPIRWVSYLVQAITGDEEEREKAKTDLTESILGNIPFLSNLAGFVGLEDIGRVPISNAMPNVSNLAKLADSEVNGKYKMELAVKEFSKPLLYLGLPVGGAQIKKTVEGIQTVSSGGSYKTNKNGEKELQFAVENPNAVDYIRAGVFGKYSLPVSKVYADRGYKALSAKQTKTYNESNIPYKEYIEYLDQKLTKKEDKIKYLSSQNWGTNEKWGIYKNEILSDTKRKDDGGSQRLDAEYMISNGVSKSEFISLFDEAERNNVEFPTKDEYKKMRNSGLGLKEYIDFSKNVKSVTKSKREIGELSGSQGLKDRDKIQILLSSDYTDEQKIAIYENYILNKNNSTYPLVKATGIDINEYMGYVMQEFDPDKVDDGTVNGKSISGSSKGKVYEYVNNMDITYEQRLMLLGMRYTLSDNEQTDLYNYVKSLDYSEDELISVFRKLKGFTVYNDGRVTW